MSDVSNQSGPGLDPGPLAEGKAPDHVRGRSSAVLIFWIIAGWVGFCLLPWYMVEDGIWSFEWLVDGYPFDEDYAPGLFLIGQGEKLWLAPILLLPLPSFRFSHWAGPSLIPLYAKLLILAGALGFGWLIAQGFSIGIRGFNYGWLEALFGDWATASSAWAMAR